MTEIPNAFGGFAPFPNTIMIPTMGLQSAVIGYRFGFGYEQGKRAVRKMSNEEFNNLDEEAEQAMFKRHDSSAIDYFKTEMHNWVALQNLIIEKSVEIEVMKANRTPSAFREMFEGFTAGFGTQQKEDAKKFFDTLGDPIMKLIAWFSGHRGTTIKQPTPKGPTIQEPFSPVNPTPFTPTTTQQVGERFERTLDEAQVARGEPSIVVRHLEFVFNPAKGFPLQTKTVRLNKSEYIKYIKNQQENYFRIAKQMGITPATTHYVRLIKAITSMKAQVRKFP